METHMPSQTYTTEQVAKLLNISRVSVYRLIRRGVLRPLSFSRHKLIPHSQMEQLIGGRFQLPEVISSSASKDTSTIGLGSDRALIGQIKAMFEKSGLKEFNEAESSVLSGHEEDLLRAGRVCYVDCLGFLKAAKTILGERMFRMLLMEVREQVTGKTEFIVHNPTALLGARIMEAMEAQLLGGNVGRSWPK